jgi:lactoylglutathione lyase
VSARPFRVLGVQQIAVGGASREALRGLWCDLLGLPRRGEFESEKENVREDIVFAGAPPFDVEIDLMEPFDPAAKPRVDQPPLHHIGLWIDDLPAAHAYLTQAGVRFTPGGVRRGAAGFDVCFIHPKGSPEAPKSGEGVLIELVQAPPEVIAAFDRLRQ